MKDSLRKSMRALRQTWSPEWIAEQSERIARRVLALEAISRARSVGVYIATRGEPDTTSLISELRAREIDLAAPCFDPVRACFVMRQWPGHATLQQGHFGILEPVNTDEVVDLDVILVPGLAFDARGFRLGHGGGHFDRILAATSALRVGLCFDAQRVPTLPVEPHDLPMQMIVTESTVITFEPIRSHP
jgi:5-formyltetrahydrofolate cyclo-ligase